MQKHLQRANHEGLLSQKSTKAWFSNRISVHKDSFIVKSPQYMKISKATIEAFCRSKQQRNLRIENHVLTFPGCVLWWKMQGIVLWPEIGTVKQENECEAKKKQRLVSSPPLSFLKMPWVGSGLVMRRIRPRTTTALAACYFKDKQLCQSVCGASRDTCGPDVDVSCTLFNCLWPSNSRKWHHIWASSDLLDIIQSPRLRHRFIDSSATSGRTENSDCVRSKSATGMLWGEVC